MDQKTPVQPPGQVQSFNGVQIYFEVHGTGEPLVLLHGFSGSSQDWAASLHDWSAGFQIILPDLRGHGRSGTLEKPFRHEDAAADMFALLDYLGIGAFKGVGVSGGGNVLLHMATKQPTRVKALVLVSATPYFPAQARTIMRQYSDSLPEQQWELLAAATCRWGRANQGSSGQHQGLCRQLRRYEFRGVFPFNDSGQNADCARRP